MNWNFKLLYENEEAFNKDLEWVKNEVESIAKYQGKLGDVKELLAYCKESDELELKLAKLYTYSSMNYDLNQKDMGSLNRFQIIYGVYMDIISASSYVDAEIISVGKAKIQEMLAAEPNLKPYEFTFKKLFDNQKHVLSAKEEKLLSYYNNALSGFTKLYDQLVVADNCSETVELKNGEKVEISDANFRGYLETLPDQEDRRKVFEAVYKFYDKHKNTMAAIYKGIIDSDVAEMKARGYDSILSRFLEHNNIPNDVFLNLVDVCRSTSGSVKKYYELRRKAFGLDRLYTYDRFLHLAEYNKTFTYEEAKALFFECVKQIGGEFEEYAHKVVEDGRVDVEIKDGKRTGAYSTGTYEEGPFILLNFDGRLDDCFTLAHEAGHSIHTTYSNANQPVSTADYTIFVAEVASTFNEQLLLDYLLKNSNDKNLKIVILQNAIDGIVSTFYRQTLFADYENEAHKLALEGKPITADSLSQIMIDLYQMYYGHDLNTEEYKKFVWCYIPHLFHSPFYVYQYATSYASSLDIYQRVRAKEPGAYENYLKLLKSGGFDYPVDLLKAAGVDLTKKDAFMAVVKRLDTLVAELEKLLEEK